MVQIDEIMLNYKCKSRRGRSPANKSDALVLCEVRENKVVKIGQTLLKINVIQHCNLSFVVVF
jgi:hypothetical protein